jgi:hypothetical protein
MLGQAKTVDAGPDPHVLNLWRVAIHQEPAGQAPHLEQRIWV